MQLSQKEQTFSQFISIFLKSSLNFENFQKKMTLKADVFLRLRTAKNVVRSMSKMSGFRGSFEKQDGKRTQSLLMFK